MRTKRTVLLGLGTMVLVALLLGACGGGGGAAATATPRRTPTPATATGTTPRPQGTLTGQVISVKHTDAPEPYRFIPDKLDLSVNTDYVLDFNVPKEFHTFTVPDLGIDIFVNAGEKVRYQIRPQKTGTFKLLCIPHEALGMVGEVRVR